MKRVAIYLILCALAGVAYGFVRYKLESPIGGLVILAIILLGGGQIINRWLR